jgi:hypothetical protein
MDTTLDAMNQQATLLALLVEKPSELDGNSKNLAANLLGSVSVGILDSVIDDTTSSAISEAASSIMDANTVTTTTTGGGRRREEEVEESNFADISSILNNLQAARTSSLFSGEDAVSIVTKNIRMSSQKVSIAESEGASFAPPRTALDVATGNLAPAIALPGDGVGAFLSSPACSVKIGITELGPHQR